MSPPLKAITQQLADHLHTTLHHRSQQPLYGGDINQSFLLQTSGGPFFIKLNQAHRIAMFEAEAAALHEIGHSNTIRVPQPILTGSAESHAFLVLEYIEMRPPTRQAEVQLGQQLAAMHQHTERHAHFGWERDNTIGSTPQYNRAEQSWTSFWRNQRIAPQLQWAAKRGGSSALIRSGEALLEQLEPLLAGHNPTPSLLHGDLWGGNWSSAASGEPLLYDPALYYGDRETDLAMTELFGGFSDAFYSAYNEAWPLDEGYQWRKRLYNLYHILNHFNLFGGGYGQQATRIMDELLAL